MAFTKTCPQCGSGQHCRRSVCEKCGFEWPNKGCEKVNKGEQEIELHRERNRVYQARKRARESELETVSCKTKNRCSLVNARSKVRPVVTVIEGFQAKVKVGPEYVCTSCHRMIITSILLSFLSLPSTQKPPPNFLEG